MQHAKIVFLPIWQTIGIVFIYLHNNYNNNDNYLPFLLQSDFLNSQVPVLVYKDFWYWELTNQMQTYYATWPIRCNSVTYLCIYGSRQGVHTAWLLLCWLLSLFLSDHLRGKRSVLLQNSQVLQVLKIPMAHQLKIAALRELKFVP